MGGLEGMTPAAPLRRFAVIGSPVGHSLSPVLHAAAYRALGVDDARYLTYLTDTEPGSSGSPVLNDDWELVALHSRAEQARDEQGRPVDVDGRPATDRTPDSRRVFVANKGIRTSAIVADLTARRDGVDAATAALIDELLADGGNR